MRHTPAKKNFTDGVQSQYHIVPDAAPGGVARPHHDDDPGILQRGEPDLDEVEAMYQAWFKAATVSVTLSDRTHAAELW